MITYLALCAIVALTTPVPVEAPVPTETLFLAETPVPVEFVPGCARWRSTFVGGQGCCSFSPLWWPGGGSSCDYMRVDYSYACFGDCPPTEECAAVQAGLDVISIYRDCWGTCAGTCTIGTEVITYGIVITKCDCIPIM